MDHIVLFHLLISKSCDFACNFTQQYGKFHRFQSNTAK